MKIALEREGGVKSVCILDEKVCLLQHISDYQRAADIDVEVRKIVLIHSYHMVYMYILNI